MSAYGAVYSARIAPCARTFREAIRNGVTVVQEGRSWQESFAADAFLPRRVVPVILAHDREEEIVGHVIARVAHGGWHVCDFSLDHSKTLSAIAMDRLRVGCPVSIGATSIRRDKLLAEDSIWWHTIARFDHLAVLAPGQVPAYPGAQITGIYTPKPAARKVATSAPTSRLPAVDEYALEQARREEHAVRAAQQGLIYRPAIGQVLAIR